MDKARDRMMQAMLKLHELKYYDSAVIRDDLDVYKRQHIDHSGNLPNLVKQGFQGNIYRDVYKRQSLDRNSVPTFFPFMISLIV